MAAACVVCSDGKLREDRWLRCSTVGRGRATNSLTTKGSRALPAAITTRAMSSAGRFQRRRSRKAIDSGARRTNEPASVTTHAIEVNVALRPPAMARRACASKPGAHARTPIPASAVRTASPSKMARTRTAKARKAARLSMLVLEARRRDHPEPGRHDLEVPGNLPGDLTVKGDVHGLWCPDAQLRHLEGSKAMDRPMHAKDGIERRAQQAPDGQVLDHDDVEGPVVWARTRELEIEKSAEDGRIDDRNVDKAQLLGSPLELDLAVEDRPFLHRDRHRHRIGQPPEPRAQIGPCREARELDVDTGRGGMHEVPRLLTVARQFSRVDPRDVAPSQQSHGLLHVHGDLDRAGEVVGGAQRNDSKHRGCR